MVSWHLAILRANSTWGLVVKQTAKKRGNWREREICRGEAKRKIAPEFAQMIWRKGVREKGGNAGMFWHWQGHKDGPGCY